MNEVTKPVPRTGRRGRGAPSGTALLLGLTLVLLLGACRGCGGREDAGTAELEARRTYPGGSFEIPFDPRAGLQGSAERGAVHASSSRPTFLYVAPLEDGEDRYRILDAASGAVRAEGTVTVAMPPERELDVAELAPGRGVTARYGEVEVEAELVDEERGTATATYRAADDAVLEVRLAADRGELRWNGVRIDGYGAPSEEEATALDELATGPLARALSMVPLDLGCVEGADEIPLEVHAALLLPWQVILKYLVADRTPLIRHFLARSSCGFPTTSPAPDTADEPENVAVFWDADHVVPSTHLFFPLDGEGQMEPLDRSPGPEER